MERRSSNYTDIYRMHVKHRLPVGLRPHLLDKDDQLFRESFLREELLELEEAWRNNDLPEVADALIDLVVVAMGTAVMMGLPWEALWQDVLRANMSKVLIRSERANGGYDLGKPPDWVPPNPTKVLAHFKDGVPAPVYTPTPKVVCLCGSTRFKHEYEQEARMLTLDGCIVLTVGVFNHADNLHLTATTKAALDQLHLHKIELADEVLIINPDGYIGESTAAEIKYAASLGKPIRYLEDPS